MSRQVRIPIFVPHLGCPHACSFCDQRAITSAASDVTGEDVKRIIESSLTTIEEKDAAVQAAFFGGSFTAIPWEKQKELLAAAFGYVKSGEIEGIRISTRPDAIDRETCNFLKEYGVAAVELGAQSSDDAVLAANRRGHRFSDVVCAMGCLKELGFETALQMMIGLYRDTPEKSLKTARDLAALKPDGARIYPTVVLKNTPLFALYTRGEYTPFTKDETIQTAARCVEVFRAAGTRLLRVGLMASEGISPESIAAGFYHPALGEMVESEIYFKKIVEMLEQYPPGREVLLYVHPRELSKAIGNRKRNLARIGERFSCETVKILARQEIPPGEVGR